MKWAVFDRSGKTETLSVDRRKIVSEFDIHLRDLRPIFSRAMMTISPKGDCVIVSLGVLKMLIGSKRVYILQNESPESVSQFLRNLKEAFQADEEKSRFEFIVLETVFSQRWEQLRAETERLERETERSLEQIQKNYSDKTLESILSLKKRLSKLETVLSELDELMVEIQQDDDEMRQFYLSKKPKVGDLEDIESILEFFSEPLEDLLHKVEDLRENIDDTQEFMNLKLNTRRNAIIRFDLLATLVTTIFSLLMVITGMYGMNIKNGIEQNFEAFVFLVGGMSLGAFLLFLISWGYMKWKKIL